MSRASRFAIALGLLSLILQLLPARAQESGHDCLNQKERRAEFDSGRLVHLGRAMHTARTRMPGTVARARLCHRPEGLVYVLTVLARDGKVAEVAVDAVKGTLVGEL
jgi:uncharacterized membrane protein YkoI